jgi:hypothetical protein
MTHVQTEAAIQSEVALTVLMHLTEGKIKDAIACFAEKFQFNDREFGLEFTDRVRLERNFFRRPSSAGALPGTPLCRRPVAGLLLEDRDGTSGGRYSRVSSGLQASVTYHHRSFNSGDPALQNKVGHF